MITLEVPVARLAAVTQTNHTGVARSVQTILGTSLRAVGAPKAGRTP